MTQPERLVTALLETGPIPVEGKRAYGGAHLGITVLDAATGETLLDVRGDDAFTPASSQKLLVTSAALYMLGADFQFQTTVLAPPLEADALDYLTLRGEGDPSLRSVGHDKSLEALSEQLYAAGVRKVGDVRIDDSAFSWPRLGSGWMWDDPAYPINAVFLEGAGTPHTKLAANEKPNPDLITDPAAYPTEVGRLFQNELTRAGIEVTGSVLRAKADERDTVRAQVHSARLAQLIRATNKFSLNHYAEQLYARLGLEDGVSTPQSSYAVLGAFLAEAGIDIEELRVRDGSGLSRYNLITPRHFTRLLHHVYQNPVTDGSEAVAAREAFDSEQNLLITSLPVAGAAGERGGTLGKRLVGSGLNVYAKTGTMTGTSSLSGFVRTASGRDLVFSMLMDNYPGPTGDLRRLQDDLVEKLVQAY